MGAAFMTLSALVCLCAAILPAAAAASGSISGTVTDEGTGVPIKGLLACAYPVPEDGNLSHCDTTDSSGKYTIALDPHGYRVTFEGESLGYRRQWYDHKDYISMDIVMVGSDPITGIDAAMGHYGRIEGVVKEAGSGKPLEGVRACAWEVVTESPSGCALTAANGSYSIPDLRQAEYAVEFLPEGNQLWQAYDHKESLSDADPVSVGPGEIVTGINAELPPAAQVEGVVRRADNEQPFLGVEICALSLNDEESFRCAHPESDGSYSIPRLATDEYQIEFWPLGANWQTQFWDHKASWDEADPLLLAAGTTTTGIDADIVPEPLPQLPPVVPSSLATPPLQSSLPQLQVVPPRWTRRHCRKSSYRKGVGGKGRCVRRHKHHHHPRHLGTGPQSG